MAQIDITDRELIARILKEKITFSPQVDGYVIHGAIEEILENFQRKDESYKDALESIRFKLYARATSDEILDEVDRILTENGFPWQPEE